MTLKMTSIVHNVSQAILIGWLNKITYRIEMVKEKYLREVVLRPNGLWIVQPINVSTMDVSLHSILERIYSSSTNLTEDVRSEQHNIIYI